MANGPGWAKGLLILLTLLSGGISHAQYEGDDVYDPFADYSEFEENSQEEADINFFKNGRFFNVALLLGGRGFTQGMGRHVEAAPSPGLSLNYWFNLRLALQFSYLYGQHVLGPFPNDIQDPGAGEVAGNMSMTSLAFDLKYYVNTENVTRGLANLNPYLLLGFSQNSRTFSLVDQTQVAKDEGAGLDLGVGIEIPISRNEMFVGLQFVYSYVDFSTENRPLPTNPPVLLNGDVFNLHLVFGINFL